MCKCGASGPTQEFGEHIREALAIAGAGTIKLSDPDDIDLVNNTPVWTTMVGDVSIRHDGIHLEEMNLGAGVYARELAMALLTASFMYNRDIIEGDVQDEQP